MGDLSSRRYGWNWGPFYADYNMLAVVAFLADGGFELRWYGVTIPWSNNWGIGFIVRRKASAETLAARQAAREAPGPGGEEGGK